MTTKMLESEMIEPTEFMEKVKYKVNYQCEKCGHRYSRICKAVPKNDPPCPNKACSDKSELAELRLQVERMAKMIEEGRAPAQNGTHIVVKAIDETAKIVMEDFQMTNLRDGIRHGENMAPKLPPAQQAAADGYFGTEGLKARGISSKQAAALGKRAIAGAFRGMAVAPTAVLGDRKANPGESPLRVLRTEPLGGQRR